MSFQAGWEDVAKGKPYRKGYHKWRPVHQVQYEDGRRAALIARNHGCLSKKFDPLELPAQVIGEINTEKELPRLCHITP